MNWMQQEFFLKKIFHSVERFDGQDMKLSVDTGADRIADDCRW